MTLRGFFVTLLELFLLILALGTEIREFFVVAVCIGAVVIYSLVSLLLAMLTLRVDSSIDKTSALRGDTVKYTLFLKGVAILPVTGFLAVKSAEFEKRNLRRKRHTFVMVPSFMITHKFDFIIPCSHVGLWEVGIKTLHFEDIFGLFDLPIVRSKSSTYTMELAVMPHIHELEYDVESESSGDYGSDSNLDSEEGELLGDSRIYREGDTLKRINWKLSVRTKTLYARKYEMPQKPRISVVTDCAFWEEDVGDSVDIACESAISLVKFFIEYNNLVDVVTIRNSEDYGNSNYSLKTIKDVDKMQYNFACVPFYKDAENLELDIVKDAAFLNADKVYIITSNPSDGVLNELITLVKNGKVAKCIVPKTHVNIDVVNQMNYYSEDVLVVVDSIESIPQKVGAAL